MLVIIFRREVAARSAQGEWDRADLADEYMGVMLAHCYGVPLGTSRCFKGHDGVA